MSEHIDESTPIEAWWFCSDDGVLAHPLPDGTRPKIEAGQVLHVEPPLVLCERGLHGSIRALDALQYAPGAIICRTAHWGNVEQGEDKLCSEYRQVLWMADASATLHAYACDVAEEALQTAGVKDARSWHAIDVKRAWIKGEATDDELAAARAAARDAAGDAAWDAAWDAARAAAWAAAWAAARAAQNVRLEKILMELAGT